MNLADDYKDRLGRNSDMAAHLPTLALLATRCKHVTEFGVRLGHSTIALLQGLAERGEHGCLTSYDIAPSS